MGEAKRKRKGKGKIRPRGGGLVTFSPTVLVTVFLAALFVGSLQLQLLAHGSEIETRTNAVLDTVVKHGTSSSFSLRDEVEGDLGGGLEYIEEGEEEEGGIATGGEEGDAWPGSASVSGRSLHAARRSSSRGRSSRGRDRGRATRYRDRKGRPFSKGYLRSRGQSTRGGRFGQRPKRAPRNPSWMRGGPIQKVELPPSTEPLPGPICRQKNLTECKPRSNPYLNGNLQMLNRKDLYAMAYESQPSNVYKKSKTGPEIACTTVDDCKHLGKLCVDGKCVCPVMYRGSYDCTVETKPPYSWCVQSMTSSKMLKLITDCPLCRRNYLFEHLWVRNTITKRGPLRSSEDIVDFADFSTCAVVGSSNTRNSRQGQQINNHTAVIRCNDGPTRKYESKVGKKTTLRIQNRDYSGWLEKSTEICLPYTLGNITERNAHTWSRFRRCTGVFPSKLTLNYFKYYWDMNKPRGGEDNMIRKGVQTSAGFSAILFAMHVCGKVTVYGFNQGLGHYYRKPHVNDTNRKKWTGRHHWNFEKRCLNIMRQGKIEGVKVKA